MLGIPVLIVAYVQGFLEIFPSDFAALSRPIVDGTLNMYKEIQVLHSSLDIYSTYLIEFEQKELRPTPSRSHYTFNLRDIAKVRPEVGVWFAWHVLLFCPLLSESEKSISNMIIFNHLTHTSYLIHSQLRVDAYFVQVIQGILMVIPKSVPDTNALMRLWCHETR